MTLSDRVVCDTNVLVSAALFETSKPAQAVYLVLAEGILLLSYDTLQELVEVMRRPKFDRYVDRADREEFLGLITLAASLIEIREEIHASRDVKDDQFLSVAINGDATAIVSGDNDLLVLHPFREVPIVTPREFLDRLGQPERSI